MITIKAPSGGTSFQVRPPLWGYTTTINISTEIQKRRDGTYGIWDNTNNYDFRLFEGTFFLNKTQALNLINAFRDTAKGRGVNIDLILATGSGFFPFGADKGDAGTFVCRLTDINAQKTVGHPEDFFNTSISLVFDGTYPSYSPPAQVAEGALQIGTIQNLRWPPDYHSQSVRYNENTTLTRDGSPFSIDKTTGDSYEATLPMVLNESNTAALLTHLTATVRGNDVNVIPPSNSYLFGRENSGTATYVCKFIQSVIEIKHEVHNRFSFPLSFYRIS